jgi:glucosamine kinase
MAHVAGIDAGGTRSRALVAPIDGTGTGRTVEGTAATVQMLGIDGVAERIAELVREAHAGPLAALVAGVAGAGRAGDRKALTEALSSRLGTPANRVRILADVDLALDAAFGPGEPGMIVVAGTGSIACAREASGRTVRAGGWGRVLGDEGGGHDLGVRGLSAVADAMDGGPVTALRDAAAHAWGADDAASLIAAVYRDRRNPSDFAPEVLRAATAGDAVALAIARAAASELALRASWVAGRCAVEPPRFALWGGLTGNPLYRDLLADEIGRDLAGWTRIEMTERPVDAALRLARTLAIEAP